MTAPLWQPSPERIAGTNLTAFMARARRDWGVKLADYDDVYDWSVAEPHLSRGKHAVVAEVLVPHRGNSGREIVSPAGTGRDDDRCP